MISRRPVALVTTVSLTLAGSVVFAADGLENLAGRLIELRGEVESLQDEIEAKQQAHRNRMNSIAQRRTGLESEIQSKDLQLRQLLQAIEEQREKNRAANESAASIAPTLKRVAAVLKNYVKRSLPFKKQERLKSIDDLLKSVEQGDMSAPQGLNRLWTLFEDEFRLTRENGLFRQEIEVEGNSQLGDVIRLGAMMLFFRTESGRVGFATRDGQAWTYTVATNQSASQIEELFSAFEKQVRSGFFEVPNAIVGAP